MQIHRIGLLGAFIAGAGLLGLPIVELKPNRLASGVGFHLTELPASTLLPLIGLVMIAALLVTVVPLRYRGWGLTASGAALLLLTLWLPAIAGADLLENAQNLLGEGARIRNPRLLPSSALAVGLTGGYIILYGGLLTLRQQNTPAWTRSAIIAAIAAAGLALFASGQLDIYSVMVEFNTNGGLLGQRVIEHVLYVAVALTAGLIVGIGFGWWAARNAALSPVILNTVSIIQTIPSLALFGLLLPPLARIGDQTIPAMLAFIAVLLLIAVGGSVGMMRLPASRWQGVAFLFILTIATIALTVSLMIGVTLIFRVSIIAAIETDYSTLRAASAVLFIALLIGLNVRRSLPPDLRRWSGRALLAVGVGSFGTLAYLLIRAAGQFIDESAAPDQTLRDLGISGIGTAPALIALTLYSLLPLVRNTYTGLKNVSYATVDAGRGMGMTSAQLFIRVELPLALPVIMAGVRNAAISLVGITAVASVIGAGALGDFILTGIVNTSIDQILLGTIPAVLLALALDAALNVVEFGLVSPGIRLQTGAK